MMVGYVGIEIREMRVPDWPAVRAIYVAGIASGNATFETEAPEWDVFDDRHIGDLSLVAVDGDTVIGWAAASPVSDRSASSGVVETSVYVDPDYQGRGVGRLLLDALIAASEAAGNWTVQTGIFPEIRRAWRSTKAAVSGSVGRRERLGQLDGRWRDVILLERRSG